jgi:hypothetical protein
MKELAAKAGFELVNVGIDQMDAFMKEKTQLYTEGAQRLGLGKSRAVVSGRGRGGGTLMVFPCLARLRTIKRGTSFTGLGCLSGSPPPAAPPPARTSP